jgi:hypothetical protein
MQAANGAYRRRDVEAANFQTSERLAEFIAREGATPLDHEAYLTRVHAGDEDHPIFPHCSVAISTSP